MEDIVIRNIKKEDIPQVVDVLISAWQTGQRPAPDFAARPPDRFGQSPRQCSAPDARSK